MGVIPGCHVQEVVLSFLLRCPSSVCLDLAPPPAPASLTLSPPPSNWPGRLSCLFPGPCTGASSVSAYASPTPPSPTVQGFFSHADPTSTLRAEALRCPSSSGGPLAWQSGPGNQAHIPLMGLSHADLRWVPCAGPPFLPYCHTPTHPPRLGGASEMWAFRHPPGLPRL